MIKALHAAAIRGVDVRIMLSERSDMPLVQLASCSYIQEMLENEVKMYFYKKGFLHSKLMVFDDSLTLVGSTNFDSRSLEQNFEIEAFIYDEETGNQARSIFIADQHDCEQIFLKNWIKRPRRERFLESCVRLFVPLL